MASVQTTTAMIPTTSTATLLHAAGSGSSSASDQPAPATCRGHATASPHVAVLVGAPLTLRPWQHVVGIGDEAGQPVG